MWEPAMTQPSLRWKASGAGRAANLRGGQTAPDLRRRWCQQWEPITRLEGPLARTRRPNPDRDHGLSLPSGHQQVEQDRAPVIFVHQPELTTIGQL